MSNIYDKASLVLIPSGTKTSKVYSQKPTNGDGDFTFSRSTAATRVNASGNIEKETGNLLLQSNSFDTTWANSGTAETGGQSGYDGSNDAWLITKSVSDGYIYQYISQSGVQCVSVYAKANALGGIQIYVNAGTTRYQSFNLTNGTLIGSGNGIDAKIESVGNGWYRCSMSFNDTITRVRFYPMTDAGDKTTTSGSIYIQDAQLEQGLVARDVITTTTTAIYGGITDNVPRLDYTDSSCPALLLEPQRTNLATQSEYLSDSSWISSSNVFITDNVTTSPEGVQNASLINFTSSGNYFQHNGSAIVSGATYTISCYVKRAISTDQVFKIYGNNNKSSANLTATSEWQRFSHTFTADSTNFASGLTAPSTAQIYVYGFQLEAGSYATSYIPTYGSAVTRNGESNAVTGVSSLIGQPQGTLFLEAEAQSGFRTFSICDGSTSNRITIAHNVPASFVTIPVYGGVVGTQLSTSYTSGNIKIAVTYSGGNYSMFVNGTKINSASIGTFSSTLNKIEFAQGNGGNPFAGDAKQALVFPTALTDQEAIDLTTI